MYILFDRIRKVFYVLTPWKSVEAKMDTQEQTLFIAAIITLWSKWGPRK